MGMDGEKGGTGREASIAYRAPRGQINGEAAFRFLNETSISARAHLLVNIFRPRLNIFTRFGALFALDVKTLEHFVQPDARRR